MSFVLAKIPVGFVVAPESVTAPLYHWPHDSLPELSVPSLWFLGMTLPQVEAAIASGEAFRLHGDPGGPLPLPPGIQRCGVCGDPVRSPRCDCQGWQFAQEKAIVARLGRTIRCGIRLYLWIPQDEVGEAPEGGP